MNKNYIDVTKEWLREAIPNSHKVEEQLYYESDGVKYEVDGKKVVLDYSKKEREVAEWLENTFGGEIKMIPRVNYPKNIMTQDYIFRGMKFDLKIIMGNGNKTIDSALESKKNQATNFILDISKTTLPLEKVKNQIQKIYSSYNRLWLNIIILKDDNKLICVYKRKKKLTTSPNNMDQD